MQNEQRLWTGMDLMHRLPAGVDELVAYALAVHGTTSTSSSVIQVLEIWA
jgi:hypothetical protein